MRSVNLSNVMTPGREAGVEAVGEQLLGGRAAAFRAVGASQRVRSTARSDRRGESASRYCGHQLLRLAGADRAEIDENVGRHLGGRIRGWKWA